MSAYPGIDSAGGFGSAAGAVAVAHRREKTAEILAAIAAIVEEDTAGDPISGCKWTRKTTAKVAQQLRRAGIPVSPNTVARLLKQMDFRLRVNLKCLESGMRNPPGPRKRDLQFRFIYRQVRDYTDQQLPVISVDTKSRELIGPFHQPGRRWSQHPTRVLDHDFPSDAEGVAIPYGFYDLAGNEGFVSVGTSYDTSGTFLMPRQTHLRLRAFARQFLPESRRISVVRD